MQIHKHTGYQCGPNCIHQKDPWSEQVCTDSVPYEKTEYDYTDEIKAALRGRKHPFCHQTSGSECLVHLYSDTIGEIDVAVSPMMSVEQIRANINAALEQKASKILGNRI